MATCNCLPVFFSALLIAVGLANPAAGSSVTVIPAPLSQTAFGGLNISGDGSTVFGARPAGLAGFQPLYQPWRWSVQTGYAEPAIPTGTNTGFWSSWTATGGQAVMVGRNTQPSGSTDTPVLVRADGSSQPFVSPVPGYSAGRISGDGLSTLLYQDMGAGGQPPGFAVTGPSGTQFVAPAAGWSATAFSLSYDGSVAGGISTTNGPNSSGTLHMLRWTGGPIGGGPVPTNGLPSGWSLGTFGGLSGDGSTMFGSLWDSNYALHPYLFSESTGFDILLTATPDALVSAVSFDGSLALVTDSGALGLNTQMWRRGVGAIPIGQYLSQEGVSLSGFTDVRFFDMSYDGRTLLAEGALNGVYVPLVITVPGPGTIALLGLLLLPSRARR